MSAKLPSLVLLLTARFDAYIVGSAANLCNENPRDFDVVVPFSQWEKASSLIPPDAKVNHFGGWKCISEGVEVDVWPGELGSIMKNKLSTHVWHPDTGSRWIKI